MQPYFSHDIFTRENLKIKRLINTHKMEGYGVFWAIVEFLHNNENKLILDELNIIAHDLKVSEQLVESVVKNFKLFNIRKNIVSSKRVAKNFKLQKEKSELAKAKANKRWQRVSENAVALPRQCNSIAIKEKKEKEINKIKEKKEEEENQNNFYGPAHNVFLTSSQYGSLAVEYGKSLTDTIITELSHNIATGKEQAFNAELPDAHFLRLDRYARQKLATAEQPSFKNKGCSPKAEKTPPVPAEEKQECEALRHIQKIKEEGGVPPPPEFFEAGERLRRKLAERTMKF